MKIPEKKFTVYGMTSQQIMELREFWLKHHDYLPNEDLTFERIRKECVTGETLLVDKLGNERLYLGFNRKGQLVTDHSSGSSSRPWDEIYIEDWKIGGKWEREE